MGRGGPCGRCRGLRGDGDHFVGGAFGERGLGGEVGGAFGLVVAAEEEAVADVPCEAGVLPFDGRAIEDPG